MLLKCIVVDDEKISLEMIKKFVERTDGLELVGAYDNAIDASEAVRKDNPELLFLDIQMPEMSGMDMLKTLSAKPEVIFITAEEKYAVQAFEYEASDYLLKPLEYARFLKAVNKIKDKRKLEPEKTAENFFVKVDSRLIKLESRRVDFIEAFRDYVLIYTEDKKLTVNTTMKSIAEKLPESEFARVHRSYIVRIDKIVDIEDNNLVVKDKVIPIGPSYKPELMRRLKIL